MEVLNLCYLDPTILENNKIVENDEARKLYQKEKEVKSIKNLKEISTKITALIISEAVDVVLLDNKNCVLNELIYNELKQQKILTQVAVAYIERYKIVDILYKA